MPGRYEALESVMCDVIKIRLKRRNERRKRKGTPKKEMDLDVFFITSYMTLSSTSDREISDFFLIFRALYMNGYRI